MPKDGQTETEVKKPEQEKPVEAAKPEKPITDADVVEMDMGGYDLAEAAPDADKPSVEATPKAGEKSSEVPSPAEASSPDKKAVPEAAPVSKKYQLDGKTFDSPEELAAYAQAKLERGGDDLMDIVAAATSAKADKPKSDADEMKEIGEIFFEDPAKAIEMLEKRVERKMDMRKRAEDDQRAAATRSKSLWDSFYSTNPDLKASPEIVQSEYEKLVKVNPNMPVAEGHKALASAARARMTAIADSIRPAKELPDGPAITGGSSDAADVPRGEPAPVVENFMEQMKRIRKVN